MTADPPIHVVMVCTGNICRSPTAEAVLRALAEKQGVADRLLIDSAGIEAYHVGAPPDVRSQDHARRRGYELGALRARQVGAADFERVDWLLAMDRWHLAALKRRVAPSRQGALRLLMDFSPQPGTEVPDPYYGGPADFERVLDLVEAGCKGLLEHLFGR
ncbi:low molecular weight protein-tyrosine-phosphatase [Ideonella sp.]|uniref:low molecular weight protein-tyrosine-phosphatase n=1 Tax=Ideonella sp. TaxID=1929293 RepID=UPI0035AE07D5